MKKKVILSSSAIIASLLLGTYINANAETSGSALTTSSITNSTNDTDDHSTNTTTNEPENSVSSSEHEASPPQTDTEESSSNSNATTNPSDTSSSAKPDSLPVDNTTTQQKTTAPKATTPVNASYITVYRLYNKNNKEHLYTTDKNEMTTLLKIMNSDWKYEGGAWMSPKNSGVPVYRLYNPKSGEHLYTKDSYEAKVLSSKHGWKNEGRKFYSDNNGNPVYRLFNAQAGIGAHFVTRDAYEKKILTSKGWKYEGVAWKSSNTPLVVDYTPPKTPTSPKPYAKNPTYYSQLDSRWSNVKLNSSNVGLWGCVPTSLAMILRGSYGMNVDPGTVAITADKISNYGYGISGKDLINTSKAYGHNVEVVGSKQRATDLLKAGYPLIFYINIGVGHSVVVYGYNNGTVNVNDPASRRYYPTGKTTLNELWGRPSPDPIDWDAGRPVFSIK